MHAAVALLDMHERGQRSLQKLLRHCAQLDPEEFTRDIEGFGYPNVREQLRHVIGAEEYWISVVEGRYSEGEGEVVCATAEALEAHREHVARATERYLRQASEAELNTPREMWTWPGRMRLLVPARVVIRTFAHIYHHQGQVLAMCRLLGRPGPGDLDLPLD